jgi:hypothetical protein
MSVQAYIVPPAKLKGLGDEGNPMVFNSARSVHKVVVCTGKRDEHASFPKNMSMSYTMLMFRTKGR